MKYYNIFGCEIEAGKFKSRLKSVLNEISIILASLASGFAVWLIMSI